ncbi:hypothetical protein KR018_001766 [Drosophila ironensis]|nr:hypothetical protein KR018_001766 [Drosophila ironensis]
MDVVKRGFLRACKNHSYLSYQLIDDILGPLCDRHKVSKPTSKEAIKAFVAEINDSIEDMGQSLVFFKYNIKEEEYLVYATTDATPETAANTGLTPEDCMYFSRLLDKIAATENCCINWNGAYAEQLMQNFGKAMKKNRMQQLVQRWCQMGYFLELDDNVYLGPRSLVELSFYLTTNHGDLIKNCTLCKCLVMWDIKCSTCLTQFHRECIHKYLQKRDICPCCGSLWTTTLRRSTGNASK